ncbi:MAG: hypothetical protein ACRC33_27040 [Gemmataceae bacterium]
MPTHVASENKTDAPLPDPTALRVQLYPLVAICGGSLLVAAVVFKLMGAASANALPSETAAFPPAVMMAAMALEGVVGFWILTFWRAAAARCAAIVFFGSMAVAAAWLGLHGRSSCGCFGTVPVHPWVTVAVDAAFVAAFALTKPAKADTRRPLLQGEVLRVTAGGVALMSVLACTLAVLWRTDLGGVMATLRGESLSLNTATHDSGQEKRGEGRRFDVVVRSHSAREVRLIGARANCSSVSTEGLPLTIPPGGEATVPMVMTFVGPAGPFEYNFVYCTTDRTQPKVWAAFTSRRGMSTPLLSSDRSTTAPLRCGQSRRKSFI